MSFTSFPLNLLLRPKPVSHLITIPIYLILPYFQFHMQISFANIPNLNVPCYSEGTEIRLIPPTILRRASKLFYNFFSQHELLPDTLSRDKKKPVQNSGRKIICHPRICDTHYQHTIHPIRVEQVTQPECSKGAKDEVKPGGPLNFNFSIMECVSGGPVW